MEFLALSALQNHQRATGHFSFHCLMELRRGLKSQRSFEHDSDLVKHQERVHRHWSQSSWAGLPHMECSDCNAVFQTSWELRYHARDYNHGVFRCSFAECDSTFTRESDLVRHELQHDAIELPKFPCPHCSRHRGSNGFKRKDHLTQHLRNYHNMELEAVAGYGLVYACTHQGCPESRPLTESWVLRNENHGYPFKTKAEQTKHLKEVHDESIFPCPEPYCDKVGGQGYMRKSDLTKHIKVKHGKAATKSWPPVQPQFQVEMPVWNIADPVPTMPQQLFPNGLSPNIGIFDGGFDSQVDRGFAH
jgi:hypothetical protein